MELQSASVSGGYFGNSSQGHSCSADTGTAQIVVPFTLTFQLINLDADINNTKSDRFFKARAHLISLLWAVFVQLQPAHQPIGVDVLYFTYVIPSTKLLVLTKVYFCLVFILLLILV